MELKETQATIKRFRDYVIQQSRSNLTKGGKNVSKKLYNSLKGEILLDSNYTLLGFTMDDYGAYQDKGVKGKFKSNKAPDSPYKFGSGSGRKGGLTEGIEKWVKTKGIQFRDKKSGKFITYKSTAFIIARSIFATGLKPSLFFTKPFEKAFERLPDELVEAYGLDVEQFLQYTINKK